MIHDQCATYFNTALRRCPHCGLFWCPRCRNWFTPAGEPIWWNLTPDELREAITAALTGKEASDHA